MGKHNGGKNIMKKITSINQELKMRIDWLEEGLNKLINHYSYTTVPKEVRNIAQSYLDGEPTTADKFNSKKGVQNDPEC